MPLSARAEPLSYRPLDQETKKSRPVKTGRLFDESGASRLFRGQLADAFTKWLSLAANGAFGRVLAGLYQ